VGHDSAARVTHGFVSYYAAARALVAGHFGVWVYDDAQFGTYVRQITGSPVREIFAPNTPAMALFALPVAWLNPQAARQVWLALSLVALIGSVAWLATYSLDHRGPWVSLWVAIALVNPAVLENLRTAQAYLLIFGALTLAVWALIDGREALTGAALGVVFAMKPTFGPLLLVLLWQRRMRVILIAGMAAVVVILATIPLVSSETWFEWPRAVATFTARPSTSVTAYQTTTGFIRHLCVADAQLNPTAPANCSPIAPILPWLLIAVATLVTFWASQATPAPLWIVSGVCLSLLAVPIAEDHQFVALAIPLFLLPTAVPEQRWWLLIVGALFLLPERYTWERFTSGWSSLFAYPRLYATWMLWTLTIATMRRHRTIAMAPSDQGRLTS